MTWTKTQEREFAAMLFAMGELFNEPVSEMRAEMFLRAVEDLPFEAIVAAAQSAHRAATFFPKPAELRAACWDNLDDQAAIGWEHVLREVRRVGYLGTPTWSDAGDAARGRGSVRRAGARSANACRPTDRSCSGSRSSSRRPSAVSPRRTAGHWRQATRSTCPCWTDSERGPPDAGRMAMAKPSDNPTGETESATPRRADPLQLRVDAATALATRTSAPRGPRPHTTVKSRRGCSTSTMPPVTCPYPYGRFALGSPTAASSPSIPPPLRPREGDRRKRRLRRLLFDRAALDHFVDGLRGARD